MFRPDLKKMKLFEMKKLVSIIGFCLLTLTIKAQSADNPVSFNYKVKKIDDKEYEVRIIAIIENPWHIYSQFTPADGPSLPTAIHFTRNPLVEVVGKPVEKGELITKKEDVLNVELKYYGGTVEFVQKLKVKNGVKTNLNGSIEYMACTDQRCLMPTSEAFSIGLK